MYLDEDYEPETYADEHIHNSYGLLYTYLTMALSMTLSWVLVAVPDHNTKELLVKPNHYTNLWDNLPYGVNSSVNRPGDKCSRTELTNHSQIHVVVAAPNEIEEFAALVSKGNTDSLYQYQALVYFGWNSLYSGQLNYLTYAKECEQISCTYHLPTITIML